MLYELNRLNEPRTEWEAKRDAAHNESDQQTATKELGKLADQQNQLQQALVKIEQLIADLRKELEK